MLTLEEVLEQRFGQAPGFGGRFYNRKESLVGSLRRIGALFVAA